MKSNALRKFEKPDGLSTGSGLQKKNPIWNKYANKTEIRFQPPARAQIQTRF